MENCYQSLPGITQIGYCLCSNLQPNIVLKHSSGLPVGVFTEIVPIRFFGSPSCETTEEYDNNGRKVVTSLTFVTNDNIPTYKHLAFVITDISELPISSALVNVRTPSSSHLRIVVLPHENQKPIPTKSVGLPLLRLYLVQFRQYRF